MSCPIRYAGLPCHKSGIAYTKTKIGMNDSTVELRAGHVENLPALQPNQYFHAVISSACDDCCEEVVVTGIDEGVVSFDRLDYRCGCFPVNSKLSYCFGTVESVAAVAREVGINVLPPLVYDCETNTISLDCSAFSGCGPCTKE